MMVGLLLLLVSTATTKRMNSSLLDQVELVRSEKRVALKSSDACRRDLKMKIEEIRKINEEIDNIKINNLKENNEHQKRKTDLDESNKLLLQLLMQARQEKKTLMGKISSLEKEILKSKEQIINQGEELKSNEETVGDREQKDNEDIESVDNTKQEDEKDNEPF